MKACLAGILMAALCGLALRDVCAQALPDDWIPPSPAESSLGPESSLLPPAYTPPTALLPDQAENTFGVTLDEPDRRFAGCCDAYGNPSGFTFHWAPDRWAKVGAAIHTAFNSVTPYAQGISGSYFSIDNARLLTSGQVTEYIGFELNSDVALSQDLNAQTLAVPTSWDLLDTIAKFESSDTFNVWIGQFLPPSDRSNIDGPFFINGWDFPFVSNYPNIIQGRQIGAAYWGQYAGGIVKWSAGAFNGTGATPVADAPNPFDNIQFDARVTVNFLDPEPGYYHQSSYYGKKDIFAVGFAVQAQRDATGTAADPASFVGLNVDALYERVLANEGVFTLEGAMYRYDDQNLPTSTRQGQSGFAYAGYMFPNICSIGPIRGRWRPFVRFQQYNRDFLAASTGLFSQGLDVGTEYVMNGPNARITVLWGQRDVIGGKQLQLFRVGAQVIF